MTVSGPCVIEVTEAETGWGLSSAVSDRKWRRGRWGGGGRQLSSWHAVYPSVGLCVCLNFSPSLSHSIVCLFRMPASLFQPLCLLSPVCPSVYFLFFSPASTDDGWMNFALSSPCQTLHQEKQWETHK